MSEASRRSWVSSIGVASAAALLMAVVSAGCSEGSAEEDGVYQATASAPPRKPVPRAQSGVLLGLSPKDGPDVVQMDSLPGQFGACRFSHKAHAEMARMGDGCAACHHLVASGKPEACGACHTAPLRDDKESILGLKGAYHYQCMDCHSRWGGSSDCASCHPGKDEQGQAGARSRPTTVSLPGKIEFKTPLHEGTIVRFSHSGHKEAGTCADCHRQATCESCHGKRAEPRGEVAKRSAELRHARCDGCHGKGKDLEFECSDCHSKAK